MLKADSNGRFSFPRSFNLIGPPCTGGAILIRTPEGQRAGGAGGKNELRLAVSAVAGPPAMVKIRSYSLGVAEWSSDTGRVSQQAPFKVRKWALLVGSSLPRWSCMYGRGRYRVVLSSRRGGKIIQEPHGGGTKESMLIFRLRKGPG